MKFTTKPLILLLIVAFFSSCADNLDFDQIQLDIDPVFTTPIVYFELNQNDFFDEVNAVEITTVTDISDFTVLQSSTVQDNLTQAVFNFEVENRFDRTFIIKIDFLDDNDNITYSVSSFAILAGDLDYVSPQIRVYPSQTPDFLNSTKLNISVNIQPSPNQLDPDIPKTLTFKSSGTYYLSF